MPRPTVTARCTKWCAAFVNRVDLPKIAIPFKPLIHTINYKLGSGMSVAPHLMGSSEGNVVSGMKTVFSYLALGGILVGAVAVEGFIQSGPASQGARRKEKAQAVMVEKVPHGKNGTGDNGNSGSGHNGRAGRPSPR